jgi:hypothetical protein
MFKYFSKQTKVFFYYLTFTLLIQSILTYCYINKIENIVLMNVFTIGSISYNYFLSKLALKYYKVVLFIVIFISLYYIWTFGLKLFNVELFIICSFYLCFINMRVILNLVKNDDSIFLQPQFYISAGLLIFIFSVSCSMLLVKYIISSNFKVLDTFYTILISCVTVIANLFYIKAFLCNKKMTFY